jgi:hypothetical protein
MGQKILESSGLRRFLASLSLVLAVVSAPRHADAQSTDVAAEASQSYRPSVGLGGAPGVDVGAAAVQVAVSRSRVPAATPTPPSASPCDSASSTR